MLLINLNSIELQSNHLEELIMDYAIVLYFDEASENKIQTIINKVAENGINYYMIDSNFRLISQLGHLNLMTLAF